MSGTDVTKIIINGCLGRLGAAISHAALADKTVEVVAGVDITPPADALPYSVYTDIYACDAKADALLLCAPPHAAQAIVQTAQYALLKQIPLVVCTTGLSAETVDEIKKTAEKNAVLFSANLSLGITLLTDIINKAAKLLYNADFDIEIIERHHNQKLDAPSGTAYLLADAANTALGGEMCYIHDRSTVRKARQRNEIGIHALRGGTVTGEHSVVFAGPDEVIELKHAALSRHVFAAGGLKAARFIKDKPPGLYTMQDLL